MASDLIPRSAAIEALLKQPNTLTPSVIRRVLRQVPGVDEDGSVGLFESYATIECETKEDYDDLIEKLELAESIVRCKDCIHYDFGVCLKIYSDGAVSQFAWQARNDEDFCSYGEWREENVDTEH